MPIDLEVDESGNLVFRNGDLVMLTDESDTFEQALMLWVQNRFVELIGENLSHENILAELRKQAQRVANSYDYVDGIVDLTAIRESRSEYNVSITYAANRERTLSFLATSLNEVD